MALRRRLSQQLVSVALWNIHYYDARFEQLGLGASTARAFINLDPDAPLPTQELARRLSCDPSNVTPFVDRLEEAGLVERRIDRRDRRVKTLVVTERGRELREQMASLMANDVPTLEALSEQEQATLLALLDKAQDAAAAYDARRAPDQPISTS